MSRIWFNHSSKSQGISQRNKEAKGYSEGAGEIHTSDGRNCSKDKYSPDTPQCQALWKRHKGLLWGSQWKFCLEFAKRHIQNIANVEKEHQPHSEVWWRQHNAVGILFILVYWESGQDWGHEGTYIQGNHRSKPVPFCKRLEGKTAKTAEATQFFFLLSHL